MSQPLLWTIIGAVATGFVAKMMLEWFNQTRYKPIIDLAVAVTVFISIGTLIIRGIQTAINVLNSIPK